MQTLSFVRVNKLCLWLFFSPLQTLFVCVLVRSFHRFYFSPLFMHYFFSSAHRIFLFGLYLNVLAICAFTKKNENKIKTVVWVWLCTTKAKHTVNENRVQKTWYAKVQRLWTNSMYTIYIEMKTEKIQVPVGWWKKKKQQKKSEKVKSWRCICSNYENSHASLHLLRFCCFFFQISNDLY